MGLLLLGVTLRHLRAFFFMLALQLLLPGLILALDSLLVRSIGGAVYLFLPPQHHLLLFFLMALIEQLPLPGLVLPKRPLGRGFSAALLIVLALALLERPWRFRPRDEAAGPDGFRSQDGRVINPKGAALDPGHARALGIFQAVPGDLPARPAPHIFDSDTAVEQPFS